MNYNVIIVNCRSSKVRYLPMFEIFLAGQIEEILGIRPKVITVFNNRRPRFILENIRSENDLIIFWEYFSTKAISHLEKYFETARYLKDKTKNVLFFGGYWATNHARYFREFDIFEHIFEGYSIDKIVNAIKEYNANSPKYIDVRGAVDWNKHDLKFNYLRNKYDYYYKGTLWGYLSSFSCPRSCKFCVSNAIKNDGSPFSPRSVEKVKNDIDLILNEYPDVRKIAIKDMNFFYDKGRAFDILNYFREKNLKSDFNVDVTVYDIDREFIERLSGMNIISDLYFGLESFNEETRAKIGKKYTREMLENTFELMDKYKINLTGNIIIGFPWQKRSEVEDAIKTALYYMRRFKYVFIAMNVWKPICGTELQIRYVPDLQERLSFDELLGTYRNQISKFKERLYGKEFNFINLEKLAQCMKFIMRLKRTQNISNSRIGKRLLGYIRSLYEKQLKKPYFSNFLISYSLRKYYIDIAIKYILPLFRYKIDSVLIKKIIRKFSNQE